METERLSTEDIPIVRTLCIVSFTIKSMTEERLNEAGIRIDPDDTYGHGFYDDCIMIVCAEEDAMTQLLKHTRHGNEDLWMLKDMTPAESDLPIPSGIYFHTSESWYLAKTADFCWQLSAKSTSASFLVYKIKAQYMASAMLRAYELLYHAVSIDGSSVFLLQRNV